MHAARSGLRNSSVRAQTRIMELPLLWSYSPNLVSLANSYAGDKSAAWQSCSDRRSVLVWSR